MLITPKDFLKQFLWKYVDISVTNSDMLILAKMIDTYLDINDFSFFHQYDVLDEESAKVFVFILSNIDLRTRERFLKYFEIQAIKVFNEPDIINLRNVKDASEYIDSREKVELFILSMYQYF